MTFLPLNTDVSLVAPSSTMRNTQSSLDTPVWAKSAGGSRSGDINSGNAIAVDSAGNTYITGRLQGSNIAIGSTNISTRDGSPDAFVTKLDAAGNFLWAKTFAGSSLNPSFSSISLDVGQGITVDSVGNVFVIGSFQGTMELGGTSSLTSKEGSVDIFVLKLNGTDGSVTWGKNFGGAGNDVGFAIGLDSNNNSYITGTFGSTSFPGSGGSSLDASASFGSIRLTRTGDTDAFIAKLDGANGNVVWAKKYGGDGSDTGFGVAATSTGVYVTGSTESAGNRNVFAVKLDSGNGNTLWNKNFGGTGEDVGKAIAVDSAGNAYLTGYLKSSTANFDGFALQNTTVNFFAAKLNGLDGSVNWAQNFGGLQTTSANPPEHYSNGIALDGSGNIYLTGFSTSSSLGDIFVFMLDPLYGQTVSSRVFGGSKFDSAYGITVDTTGNYYLTGEFLSPSLTFGNQTLTSQGGGNLFVAKLRSLNPIVTTPSPLDLGRICKLTIGSKSGVSLSLE